MKQRSIVRGTLAIAAVVAVAVLIRTGYARSWTGFAGKTLWDWLDLFIVPAVLAIGAFLFNRAERRADRLREENRAELEYKLAVDRTQEAALQSFLNQMTDLLLEQELLASRPGDEVRDVARARTLSTLNVLDGTRKATVLEFLHKSNLINKDAIISLRHAFLNGLDLLFMTDLHGANLAETFLNSAGLVAANLKGADLRGAYLRGTHLNGADLTGADLTDAVLSEATMMEALMFPGDITSDELKGAVRDDTDLSEGDLEQMLEGTILRRAVVTDEQLAAVRSLKGAIMPDGSRYNGRFNLPGDVAAARIQGIDTGNPQAMARWYAGS